MESAVAKGVVGGPGGFFRILTRVFLAAFPTVAATMPCIATEPEGPEEAGCNVAAESEEPGGAAFTEVEVEGCGASAGIILECAALEELAAVEAGLAGAGMDLEIRVLIGGSDIGVVVGGPLVAEIVEGRFTATIFEEGGKTFGE